jgi:hypothetical protein
MVFEMTEQDRDKIKGQAGITEGSLRNGALSLALRHEESRYLLTAKTAGNKFAGRWSEIGTAEGGSCECERGAPAPYSSPAIVPLYQYRTAAGRPVYSSRPRSPDDPPVARVWRNPMSLVILDRGARPAAK